MYFRLYITFIFLFFGYSLSAQEAMWFDHLGVQKGLSQNSVLDIAQDSKGFMWIGTRHGLNRYDGYSFKVYLYDEQDSNSVINNYIYDLLVDSHKRLWVATSSGISIYQTETDNFKNISVAGKGKSGLTDPIVRCLYEDRDGNIWAGTINGLNLIARGNTKDIKHLFHVEKSSGKGKTILGIMQDKEGSMWIGTTSGLIRLRKGKNGWNKQVFNHSDKTGSISDNYITSLITDKNDNLWVGTLSGLNLFDPATETFKHFKHNKEDKNSLIHNSIRKITFDVNGKMWIGTLGGISIMDIESQTFRNVQSEPGKPHSLNQNSVYALYKDLNGSMWVGTYFGGININYPYTTAFKVVQKSSDGKGISNNVVSGFAEDAAGSFWVGTEGGGINRRLKGDNKYVSFNNGTGKSPGPTSSLIKMLLVDKQDNLWAGTHAGGLNRYKPETNKFEAYYFNSEKDEFPDEITALTEDAMGSIWVSTQRNGLWQFNREQQAFNKPLNPVLNKELANQARCLYFSREGKLYIGTTSGLIIYDRKKDKTYSLSNAKEPGKLLPYYINCITETRNGLLFLGTDYGGLLLYDRKKNLVTTFTTENGLPHNTVLGILEDEHGFLWISTANGLSRMDPGQRMFKNYTVADGLPSNEFNRNAYYRAKNGEFYFGGYNGFISFRPQHIQSNIKRAPIVLTDIQVDRKSVRINDKDGILKQSVTYSKEIKLKYVQNTFSLHFALLNFVKPEKNKYQYMLEGFEKNWIKTDIPNASYTNLPPGKYLFKVRGINNDGYSSINTIQIPIVIKPPFYFTWWAYTIYFVFFIGVLTLIFRYLFIRERLRSEKESNAKKLEFFTHISHEIRTPLTLILPPLEQLIRNENNVPPPILPVLKSIQSNANRLVLLVTELLDFRKADAGLMQLYVDSGDIVAFNKKIFEAFRDLAEIRNIDYKFQANPDQIIAFFDSQQLEKVFYNLLSNAFKFTANEGQIVVQLAELESSICITVTDNGKGIPQNKQKNLFTNFYQANPGADIGTGLGLSLSKKILDLHHADINIESNIETADTKGFTRVTVTMLKGSRHFESGSMTALDSNHASNIYQTMAQPTVKVNSHESAGNRRYTILITEDNPEVRDMIHNILAPNYFILEAKNGQEGFEQAITHIPDLVISDVTMPIVDGFEFCNLLKTDPRTSHIPVILLTARSAKIHQVNGLEQGADVYLTKPFDARILELNIQNALSIREAIKLKFQVALPSQVNQFGNSTEQIFIEKVIKLIDTHLSDQTFGVSELASGVGMSNPVLYKKIRAITGLSVNEFIKHIRLQTASSLLRDSNVNITEVAYAVGFSSRKYFSLEFKKAFNKSPSEFREALDPLK